MRFFDENFSRNKARYILQCLLATTAVLVILLILDAIHNAVVIAALGASAFVAFALPHANVSRAKFLVGGYAVAVIVGGACSYLAGLPAPGRSPMVQRYYSIIFGALAVGGTIFVMTITETEHPPAAGLALGFVLGEWSFVTVLVVLIGICSLAVIKRLLKPILINLVRPSDGGDVPDGMRQ